LLSTPPRVFPELASVATERAGRTVLCAEFIIFIDIFEMGERRGEKGLRGARGKGRQNLAEERWAKRSITQRGTHC
jgi:hypothetical protein